MFSEMCDRKKKGKHERGFSKRSQMYAHIFTGGLLYSSSMHMFCALLLIRTRGKIANPRVEFAFVAVGKNSNSAQNLCVKLYFRHLPGTT